MTVSLSAARKRLHHEDFVGVAHGIAEPQRVPDTLAADEDDDMPPHPTLVIEHIASQARISGEHRFERSSNRPARGLAWRSRKVALEIGGEYDPRYNDLRLKICPAGC